MDDKKYPGLFFNQGHCSGVEDVLALEGALSITINSLPYTVTMRTPGNELDLVRGLLFSEGIYTDKNLHPAMHITAADAKGFVAGINVEIPDYKLMKSFSGDRNIMSLSSCGICGKTSLDDKIEVVTGPAYLEPEIVSVMFEAMSRHQDDFHRSGGTHAAAAFTAEGELLVIREDIGRHNAVDKVSGALLFSGKLEMAQCLTVSGRISYEIVQKAMKAGIPILASVSAPSSLAVENALACGITLLAFCRDKRFTVYSHPERMVQVPIA